MITSISDLLFASTANCNYVVPETLYIILAYYKKKWHLHKELVSSVTVF
jgi:hypothetical protein